MGANQELRSFFVLSSVVNLCIGLRVTLEGLCSRDGVAVRVQHSSLLSRYHVIIYLCHS